MSDKYDFPRIANYRALRPNQKPVPLKDGEVPGHAEFDEMKYVRIDIYNDLLKEMAELSCPGAAGFDGPETFLDCGECVVCRARKEIT